MKYPEEKKPDAVLPPEEFLARGESKEAPATAELPRAGVRLLPASNDQPGGIDYSEDAIPERDPSYRLPGGTLSETRTVEHLPAAERLALARCLEQLGMSRARALIVASL